MYYVKISIFLFNSLAFTHLSTVENGIRSFTVQINGYKPLINDDYVSTSLKIEPGYIIRFEPIANADFIHHMILYACAKPARNAVFWRGMDTCSSFHTNHILYAWARNAPSLELPKDVAFSIGHDDDDIHYLVLQLHYARPLLGDMSDYSGVKVVVTDQKPEYFAAIYLFASNSHIMPRHSHFQTNLSCIYRGNSDIHPFAYRTHAHTHGRVISAYFKNSLKQWVLIGKRNPQWPQLFEPIRANLTIKTGDLMAATCVYDTSEESEIINMGHSGRNEMCNFYMMYYWNSSFPNSLSLYQDVCTEQEERQLASEEYPPEGISLLPSHPELEEKATQIAEQFGMVDGLSVTEVGNVSLGQISGLSFDIYGNLVIFHRASRVWNRDSFDFNNNLRDRIPISDATIVVVSPNVENSELILVGKYGRKQFYMPHGIFVDQNNDIYTTDVGSHQVLKWTHSNEELKMVYALGEQLIPGYDRTHFCQPTSVTAINDGSVFVADGYCNSRIVKFDAHGQYISEWGRENRGSIISGSSAHFRIPHDLTSNEDGSLLYISDRENARIQIYSSNGHFVDVLSNPLHRTLFTTIYSTEYYRGSLFFVSGRSVYDIEGQIFVGHANSSKLHFTYKPTHSLNRPHVVRVSPKEGFIYVGELDDKGGRLSQYIFVTGKNYHVTKKFLKNNLNRTNLKSYVEKNQHSELWLFLMVAGIVIIILFLGRLAFAGRKSSIRMVGRHSIRDKEGFKPLRMSDSETSEEETIREGEDYDF